MMQDATNHATNPLLACRSPFIALPERGLEAFCRRWEIHGLRLVGSAIHGPFHEDSDIDFVVYASIKSPLYASHGQPIRREAVDELRHIIGRKVDLVCPRVTLASANPYAIYNLLVEHKFERNVGLAWYLHSAAHLLSHAALPAPEAALAAMPGRHMVLFALMRLARACDTESRIADLHRRGLEDVPFAAVRASIGPVLASVRALERPRWPSDTSLAELTRRLAPHVTRIVDVTADLLPALPPEIPSERIEEALVDAPVIRERDAQLHQPHALTFVFDGKQLALDRGTNGATRHTWGVLKLVVNAAAFTDRGGLSSVGEIVCFAPTHKAVYLTSDQIEPDALVAFRSLVQRGNARLLCTQRLLVSGCRSLLYSVVIRTELSADRDDPRTASMEPSGS